MESYIKSGHEGVVSISFSFSTSSCWHWILTSVFVVTVTPSHCSLYCILSPWTCHPSVSCQRNTFCWGSEISVLSSQTHLSWSTSISGQHADLETLQGHLPSRPLKGTATQLPSTLEFLDITGGILAFPWVTWQRVTLPLRDPLASKSLLFPLFSFSAFWKSLLLILWPLKVFPLLPSLPACSPWFSVSLVDFFPFSLTPFILPVSNLQTFSNV